ncbi:MAG: cyclodeaminase [Trueperaceae bacterium]|nr:cyclodeaminase [Trueperaceae bacterium]
MKLTVLTEADLRACVTLDRDALDAVADGFRKLGSGDVTQPPIMRVDVPDHHGEVDIKSAYIRGVDSFAVKLSSGFFENYKRGLPSASGLMILLSAETGVPQALLLDNGYLTDVRTGLAGAIAADTLAKKDVDTVGVIGCGAQARYQLRALRLVRDFSRVLVYGRQPDRVRAYADEMGEVLGVSVEPQDAETVVRRSDVVVTTTPATEPVVKADWLHPGLHITALGSDAEHKQELEAEVMARATHIICDSRAQCERLGELRSVYAAGLFAEVGVVYELGAVLGTSVRQHDDDITVCDLTGTGVQDTAIARFAFGRARERGLGMTIDA